MGSEIASCAVCQKQESNVNKILTCMYCFSTVHFHCKNIVGSAVNKIKARLYFCTVGCSEIYKRIMEVQDKRLSMIDTLASELKATVSNIVADQMGKVKSEVRLVTAAIEKSQDFLASKFDDIVSEFMELKAENERLKQRINDLNNSHSKLANMVYQLESNVDKFDRKSVSNNAILLGLPQSQNESVTALVDNTFAYLGVDLPAGSIVSAVRLYQSNKPNVVVPIRITFSNRNAKELALSSKKSMGSVLSTNIDRSLLVNGKPTNVSLRDELTPASLEMLRKMREHQEALNIRYVWSGNNGSILVKKSEGSKPDIIRTREDLSRIIEKYSSAIRKTSPNSNVSRIQSKSSF